MASGTAGSSRRAVLAYVSVVHLLAVAMMLWICTRSGVLPDVPAAQIAFWLFFTLAAELFWLATPSKEGMVSMSLAVNIATLYLLPPHLAVAVVAVATLVADLVIHRRGVLKSSFNASQTAVTVAACALLIRRIGGDPVAAGAAYLVREPLAVAAGPMLFFVLNTGLVAGVIALHSGQPLFPTWRRNYGTTYQFLSSGTLALLGWMLVAVIGTVGQIAGIVYLLFFYFVRDAYNRWAIARRSGLSSA